MKKRVRSRGRPTSSCSSCRAVKRGIGGVAEMLWAHEDCVRRAGAERNRPDAWMSAPWMSSDRVMHLQVGRSSYVGCPPGRHRISWHRALGCKTRPPGRLGTDERSHEVADLELQQKVTPSEVRIRGAIGWEQRLHGGHRRVLRWSRNHAGSWSLETSKSFLESSA
jgi:hypothetical protein